MKPEAAAHPARATVDLDDARMIARLPLARVAELLAPPDAG